MNAPPRLSLLLFGVLLLPAAQAQAGTGSISAIKFRGNEVTRDEVMRREIGIAVGEAADDTHIEHSRQAIQDLGLFRKVEALQEPDGENTRVVFTVKEKWYLLVYPRLSANTDGQNALGGELRWNNLFGRNHRLRAVASSADNRDEGRGREMKLRASYSAPFVFGSEYGIDLAGASSTTPVEGEGASYDESVTELELIGTRHYGLYDAASQGWNLGTGIKWRNEDTRGEFAPEPWGDTYAWVLRAGYRDVRDHLYSETGTRFEASYEIADQNAGSEYSYSNLKAEIQRSMALGSVPHQTLELSFATGSFNNGPFGRSDYSLGGTNGLRGYDRDRFEGDFYYLFTAAYLRPVHWDWLRFVATFEAGNVFAEADALNTEVHTSVELGVRVRVPRLVNFEFELGYAFPIDDDSGRIYGSRNGF
ncbi:MAG: POTRA domain-containing protein [Panacagrimonas sp.]